jgi:hypothetical protein
MVGASGAHITQNTRLISHLGSVIGKAFNTHFWFSLTRGPKRKLFLQMSLQERRYSYLGCVSTATQNGSHI